MDISLADAIEAWWHGEDIKNRTLFDWKILYWGRLGKVLALVGGRPYSSIS